MPDLIDVARPPSPRQLAVDVRSASARAVGLYCVNWSINWAEQSPAYIAQLRDMHIAVLPIVVPSDQPQAVATAIAKLLAWGLKPTDTVVLDLERFSLPPLAWVAEFCQRWPMAGIYCQQNYRHQYEAARPRFWWLAAWGSDSSIPPGWTARQYGSWRSPSLASTLYDASSVSPTLRFWGESGTPAQPAGGDEMDIELAAGKEVWVPADGTTQWNAVAQSDGDVTLLVMGYNSDGSPTASGLLPRVLKANQPDVRGPETVSGTGFGITGSGGLAYFHNDGPGSVLILIRYAA
jgi:hypothetical protein